MIAKLQNLIEGDKFSFIEDTERIVWHVDYIEMKEDVITTSRMLQCRTYHLLDDNKNKKKVAENSKVVFY